MEDLNAYIRAGLIKHRPDRYDPTDRQWMTPVVTAVANLVPAADARIRHAESLVRGVEQRETMRANKLLREIGRSKQWPLEWMDYAQLPIAVGGERVCLSKSLPADLEQWAIEERRDAAQDFTSRSQACDGAEWLAKQTRAGGWMTAGEAFTKHEDDPS